MSETPPDTSKIFRVIVPADTEGGGRGIRERITALFNEVVANHSPVKTKELARSITRHESFETQDGRSLIGTIEQVTAAYHIADFSTQGEASKFAREIQMAILTDKELKKYPAVLHLAVEEGEAPSETLDLDSL